VLHALNKEVDYGSDVRAAKMSWKLTFLLEMMVTSSRMAWKVITLISQGSYEHIRLLSSVKE
jgi:hypothetical protein